MRWMLVWAAAALICVAAVAEEAPVPLPDAVQAELDLFRQADARIDAKDWQGAEKVLNEAIKADIFAAFPPEQRHAVQRALTFAALNAGDYQMALQAAREACAYEKADGRDWYLRFIADYHLREAIDAAASLAKVADLSPTLLSELSDDAILGTVRQLDHSEPGKDEQITLLKSLFAAKWRPAEKNPSQADVLWLELMRFYLVHNDQAHVKEIASIITDPRAIVAMRVEKVFDSLTVADPQHFDISAAYENAVTRARARMNDHPDLLEPVVDLALLLYELDRQPEALTVLDGALSRVGDKPFFKDQGEEINWLYDTRSRVLIALDRRQDGLAQLERAAKLAENGAANVSQVINLADGYNGMERPKDALAMLTKLDLNFVSPYGRMQAQQVRACAYAQLGDAKSLADTLRYLHEHQKDAVGATVLAMLCAADIDDAAKSVIAALADPDQRSEMLLQLQSYAAPSRMTRTSSERILAARWAALRKRPDVRAAVDSFGRILDLPVLPVY